MQANHVSCYYIHRQTHIHISCGRRTIKIESQPRRGTEKCDLISILVHQLLLLFHYAVQCANVSHKCNTNSFCQDSYSTLHLLYTGRCFPFHNDLLIVAVRMKWHGLFLKIDCQHVALNGDEIIQLLNLETVRLTSWRIVAYAVCVCVSVGIWWRFVVK